MLPISYIAIPTVKYDLNINQLYLLQLGQANLIVSHPCLHPFLLHHLMQVSLLRLSVMCTCILMLGKLHAYYPMVQQTSPRTIVMVANHK